MLLSVCLCLCLIPTQVVMLFPFLICMCDRPAKHEVEIQHTSHLLKPASCVTAFLLPSPILNRQKNQAVYPTPCGSLYTVDGLHSFS